MEVRQMLVQSKNYKVKCPNAMTAEFITLHNTANDASANNEVQYMVNNGKEISFHFAVDDKEVVQGIPVDRNAWHCGDGNGPGNRKSIGVEVCYSKSGGERYEKAEANAIKFIAQLLFERGWGIDRVKPHKHWSGKNCPHRILDAGRLDSVLSAINAELNRLKTPVTTQKSPRFHIFTGEYNEQALVTIHNYLREHNFGYTPERAPSGNLVFTIGLFVEGTDMTIKFEEFLKTNNFTYGKRYV